jgi:hypothetical protein
MYVNENTRHSSNCVRYANSQTEPHILHKNGRTFNSETLTKWMEFNTREPRTSQLRKNRNNRINQPNFGIQQRPGFFPSEVTYEFLYPKPIPSKESHRTGKISLTYTQSPDKYSWHGRHFKDTNQHRRKIRRTDCAKLDINEQEYDLEEEDMDDNALIMSSADFIDENDKWSIVFEDSGKFLFIHFIQK